MSFLIWAPQRPQPLRCHLLSYVNRPIVFQLPSVLIFSQYIEGRESEKEESGNNCEPQWFGNEISACEEVVISLWRKRQQDEKDNWAGERRGGEKQKGKQGEGENWRAGIDWACVWAAPHMSGDLTLTQDRSRWSESCTETCGSEANSYIPMDGEKARWVDGEKTDFWKDKSENDKWKAKGWNGEWPNRKIKWMVFVIFLYFSLYTYMPWVLGIEPRCRNNSRGRVQWLNIYKQQAYSMS